MKIKQLLLVLTLTILLSSCAGKNSNEGKLNAAGYSSNFFNGVLDGFVMPFTFIISLFKEDVNIYEVNNIGNWYNAGFVLGVGALGGSASSRR